MKMPFQKLVMLMLLLSLSLAATWFWQGIHKGWKLKIQSNGSVIYFLHWLWYLISIRILRKVNCISGCYSCSGGADCGYWVSKNGQRFEVPLVLPTFSQAVQISKDVQVQVMEGMTDLHTSTRVLTTKVKLDILCSSFASLQGGGIEACHHKERGATTSLKHLIFILTDFSQPLPSSKLILRKRS